MTAISTASAGISSAFDRLDRTAAAVATPNPDTDAADLASAKAAVEGNAAVLRAGTRMSTHLVDILV